MKKTITILAMLFLAITMNAQVEPTDTDADGFRNVSTLDNLKWISENSSSWADKFKWVLALLGVPITWLFMEATKNAVHGFEGDFWPARFVSFVTGMVIFTILTYVFKGEGINLKTACCLFLASLIIYIQLFWK